jgi:hypothetical protein
MSKLTYWSAAILLACIGVLYFLAVAAVCLVASFAYLVAWLIVMPLAFSMRVAGLLGDQLQSFR